MEHQTAMELHEAMESSVNDFVDVKEHFGSSASMYWTSIDAVSTSADGNVRVLPGKNVFQYTSDQFQFHDELLGEGSQGKIFKASLLTKDLNSKENTSTYHYAVKTFNGELMQSDFGQWPDELFDFHLNCQYICRFFGYFNCQNSFCLVMEKYDCSLSDCIDRHMKKRAYKGRPFHGPVAMAIIIQLAIGMAYLHRLNILHRDLKSDNILIMNISEQDDTPAAAFIGDFDVSPTVKGTGFWRAPEILQGLKDPIHLYNAGRIDTSVKDNMSQAPFTTKSDVYSFAMTCYEILTGRRPFEGVSLGNHEVVLSGKRPNLPSNLDPKMRDLLHKCWHPDPDARPSFAVIVSELKGFVQGTEAFEAIFNYSTVESPRVSNSSLESDLLELKELVQAGTTKYPQEDFAAWAVQCADDLEQFNVQFGLRSCAEPHALPSSAVLSMLRLTDTIIFKWNMFFKTCPKFIPEFFPFRRLMQTIFLNKIQEGMLGNCSILPASEEECAAWELGWNAWEEEKQKRTDPWTLVNRHDVCLDALTSTPGSERNRDRACDICKNLPRFAPISKVCTFHLYIQEKTPSLKSVFSFL